MSRETRALLRKHSQSVMVKHLLRLIHFCSCLSTLKLEKRGRVFQLKRIKLFMEHFFFAKATCEPSPGSKCFLNSKAHTRLVFPCTMHNSPLSRRQYFPSVSFPLPCFNRPLAVRVGSLRPNLEVSLVWKALASHLEVRQTTLKSNTQRSPVLQIQT